EPPRARRDRGPPPRERPAAPHAPRRGHLLRPRRHHGAHRDPDRPARLHDRARRLRPRSRAGGHRGLAPRAPRGVPDADRDAARSPRPPPPRPLLAALGAARRRAAPAPDDPPELLATTVGRPPPGVQLRIVDAQGRPLPPGEPGEVVVRSPAT